MQLADTNIFDDLLINLIIHEKKQAEAKISESVYVQIPIPTPPPHPQSIEKENAHNVIIIDI